MKPQSVKIYLLRAGLCLATLSCLTVFSLHVFKIKQRIERTEAELKRQLQGRQLTELQLSKAKEALEKSQSNLESEKRATAQAEADALVQRRLAEQFKL